MVTPNDIALFSGPYYEQVHDILGRLRVDEPVHRAVMPTGLPVWVITRYDDVRSVLTDPRIRKDHQRLTEIAQGKLAQRGVDTRLNGLFSRHLLLLDPPEHTRVRALLTRSFTARRVKLLRPFIDRLATDLLDRLAAEPGPVDLVAGFALPLPAIVISELLGVPENERDAFQDWTGALLAGRPEIALPATGEMIAYLTGLIARKIEAPADDLLSALTVEAELGDRLSGEELVATAMLLLVAGHETTSNLIVNGARWILDDPALAVRLRAEPGLLPAVVEELLRLESPVMMSTPRFTAEPVTIGDVTIPAGELVLVSVGSANRDERRFPRPDDLDTGRDAHGVLAFGHGPHYCIGAPLARLEGALALGHLVEDFPLARLAVPTNELRHRHAAIMHGYRELPVFLC
jgi:cytochrome P450